MFSALFRDEIAVYLGAFLESSGLAEAAVVVIYSLFGVPRALSVALAFSLWATSILATLPGAYLLHRNGVKLLWLKKGRVSHSRDAPELSVDCQSP